MGELQLSCPRCERSFWAAEKLAGRLMACPHCGGEIRLPGSVGPDGRVRIDQEVSADWASHGGQGPQGHADQGIQNQIFALRDALEEKEQAAELAQRELAQAKSVLVESLQQLRKTRNELEKIRSEAEATDKSNSMLNSRLRVAEETVGKTHALLQGAHLEAGEVRKELEQVKTQRNAYLWEAKRLEAALQEANLRMGKLEADRAEVGQVLQRANQNTESLGKECLLLRRELEATQKRLASASEELILATTERSELEAERGRLTQALLASQDAEALQKVEGRIAGLEQELGNALAESSHWRGKFEIADQERTELKEGNISLRLQLSSARELIAGNRLQEENEQLRAVIERTNEQMRALNRSARAVQYIALNEPFEPEEPQRASAGLRWLQAVLAKWGHSV